MNSTNSTNSRLTNTEFNEMLDSAFFVITGLQFVVPGFLTFIVVTLKLLGFIWVEAPWVYILLPVTVSIAVGVGLIAIIMLTKLFMKLGVSNV